MACWDELDDPGTGNVGLDNSHELLFIALCSVLCSAQGAVDMALFAKAKEPFPCGFVTLANGAPSHDTFNRLFRQFDPEAFRAALGRFMAGFSEQCRNRRLGTAPDDASAAGVMATDGKVLRRSLDRTSGKSALHMVSAWGCKQRLVLAQVAAYAKSNEITAGRPFCACCRSRARFRPSTRRTASARPPGRSSTRAATTPWR